MYTYQYPRAALTTDALIFVRERIPSLSSKKYKDEILEDTKWLNSRCFIQTLFS
jgi:hypothetical protein